MFVTDKQDDISRYISRIYFNDQLLQKVIFRMLTFLPELSKVVGEKAIEGFVTEKGELIQDASSETIQIYKLDTKYYEELRYRGVDISAAIDGSSRFPEVMIIGIISAYDTFLSKLLRVVFTLKPEIVLRPDKTIKLSDLQAYQTIEDAHTSIIEKEIESILRESHHEQFHKMESLFEIKLKENLPIWPKFVELCERRNLFTHTGGIVSSQYLNNCKDHGHQDNNVHIGDKLSISQSYYQQSVDIILEIGIKLCYVFWRKFQKDQADSADIELNSLCFTLIRDREYSMAEILLKFGIDTIQKRKGKDSTRRMMIINYANALRLQGKKSESTTILDKEDWSATNNVFNICVAAVKEDLNTVTRLMRAIGRNALPGPEDYRVWPVFKGLNDTNEFISTFESIFDEPYIQQSTVDITEAESQSEPSEEPKQIADKE